MPRKTLSVIFLSSFALFGFFSSICHVKAQNYRMPDGLTSPKDLSFQELKTILQKNRFHRIEDLLKYLNQNKPEYMSHYTLGYNSLSLHGSSEEYPRAIIYGQSGNFIITFNGNPDQQAFEMLEVVEFNHHSERFEYREIEFNEFGQLEEPFKISSPGGPKLDGQGKCLVCHTGSRPIWEPYDSWPGFYGADDDRPFTLGKRLGRSFAGPNNMKELKEHWESFAKGSMQRGRYQYLKPLAKSIFFGSDPRPNFDLTALLGSLNIKRIGRLLKDAVGSSNIRYPLLFALTCRNIYPGNATITQDLKRITDLFVVGADRNVFTHSVGKAGKIIKEQNISLDQLSETLNKMRSLRGIPPISFEGPEQLISKMIEESGTMHSEVPKALRTFLSLVDYYLPNAELELWPMSIYEGVHRYDTGVGNELDLFINIVNNLFTKEELIILQKEKNKSEFDYCLRLTASFPLNLSRSK